MRKKFRVTLVVFLVIVLGCFSEVFAATNQNDELNNNIYEHSRNVKLLTDKNDEYTKLLMHMDDSMFKDEYDHTVKNNGVTLDNANKKFGRGSANFNGSSYLDITRDTNIDLNSGDFTIDWWQYQTSRTKFSTPFILGGEQKEIPNQGQMLLHCGTSMFALLVSNADHSGWAIDLSAGVDKLPKLNTWSHLAVVKKDNTFMLFLDGKNIAKTTSTFNIPVLPNNLYIGCKAVNNGDTFFNGNIQEFRISKGIARWTSDFTPTVMSLDKTTDILNVGETDTLTATLIPDNIVNEPIKWTSSDSTIATVDDNGKIIAKGKGKVIITAVSKDGGVSKSCIVTVNDPLILNIEPEKTKINLNNTVSANLTIDNIQDIAAEDIRIKYDSTKLEFLGYEEVEGIKLVKDVSKDGELRIILASKGKSNIINAKKALLKLKFKGTAVGDALVDVTKGRVSDGITKEYDLTDEQCGQATITIQKLKDVDNSGEYTLLDLAIDARHEAEDPSTLPQYNTDQDGNKAIDDADLTQIGQEILDNPNYACNNEA